MDRQQREELVQLSPEEIGPLPPESSENLPRPKVKLAKKKEK